MSRGSRERLLILFVCVLVIGAIYVVLLSTGIIDTESPGFGIEPIEADIIVLRYEYAVNNSRAAVEEMSTITNPAAIKQVLSIRNSMLIKSTNKRMDNERYTLYFFQSDELIERWHIDKKGITSFTGRSGNYLVTNSFDLAVIEGLL